SPNVDGVLRERRRIRYERRRDENEQTGFGVADRRRECGHQHAELAAAVTLHEDLDDRAPRPAAAERVVERIEAGRTQEPRRAPCAPAPQVRTGKRVEPGIHGSFHRVPYDTDDDPFDRQRFLAQIDLDRLEIRVLRQEPDAMTFLPIPLDRDLVLEANDDDLPVANLGRAMHGDEIAVEDAGIAHAHAFDPQQEMRLLLEQIRIDLIARLDLLLGEDRPARRGPADARQPELPAQPIPPP